MCRKYIFLILHSLCRFNLMTETIKTCYEENCIPSLTHILYLDIAQRWVKLNSDVFERTGKLMEKYNVVDTHLEAGGGEYGGQDGFGWTNGVLLALINKYQLHPND